MNIQGKLNEIIPPNDYRHRSDFSNDHLIDDLDINEKEAVESALIVMLTSIPEDLLIIKTLAYMGSKKALHEIENSLMKCKNNLQKVIIASSIFKISSEYKMIDVAINSFNSINDDLDLALLFHYLATFNNNRTDKIIKNYINHPNFIVSYNAKQALGMIQE